MYIHMNTYIFIFIYMYIYIHTHIYIYIYKFILKTINLLVYRVNPIHIPAYINRYILAHFV